MSKNLRRKLIRDLKQNSIQFLAIFVMCFLALFVLNGFGAAVTGESSAVDKYYKESNFADLQMSSEGFGAEDLIAINSLPSVKKAELRSTSVGKVRIDGAEKKLEFNFIDDNDVSSMCLLEGEPYESGRTGIWIDVNFAARQGIHVGDELELICDGTEFSEKVMGIVDNPDHLYFMIDNTYVLPDIGAYGFAFLDSSEYPGQELVYDSVFIDVDGVENQFYLTAEDEARVEACRREITEVISKKTFAYTPKQKEGGYVSFQGDMDSYETLGTIFPVLFIAIALLGIMTTMTRLVMKQRTLIGTLKALGFSNAVIMIHYVSYSLVVSLIGGIAGAVAGWFSLGNTLISVAFDYYSIPGLELGFSESTGPVILALALAAALTNFFSCRDLLLQRASDILRPEPPKVNGAGIIEKTPVWKRLSFATRWNIRDINRNRLRTLGAVTGIILCSALLLVAFGINEMFKYSEYWEYGELTPANYIVGFSDDAGYGTVYDYAKMYNGQMVEQVAADLYAGDTSMLYQVTVVDEGNLYHFQDEDGEYISLPEYGIAVSGRVAYFMDLMPGDMLSFRIPGDTTEYRGRVEKIYMTPSLQGITITRRFFESMGGEFNPTLMYTDMTVPSSFVTDREEVTSVFSKDAYIEALRAMRASTDETVYYVMIVAVVVGIVVMYNLGILSFAEKTREIATLKVLGFPTKKIRWILQQQNIGITGTGTIIGIPIGVKLLGFVLTELDPDADYILSNLSIYPYIYAILLSFVLSFIVNAIINSKVKDINMVEALKGVE